MALVLGLVAFVVALGVLISYPYNKKKNVRCTEQTQGMLVEVLKRDNSETNPKDVHVYTYQVNGVEYRLRTSEHGFEGVKIGDSCTVWYNPSKPDDAQVYRVTDKGLKIMLRVGIALVPVAIVLTCIGCVQQSIQ